MSHKRIMVVDDEASLLLTLAANLELEGYDVLSADSGPAALDLLRKDKVDLVLSDIRMPGMDGVELAQRIRQLDANLPVVLMTAFAIEGLIDNAIREGAFTVLAKPFDVSHIVRALAAALKRPLVLIVDDDEPVAESTAAALSAVGIHARAVIGGFEAFEVLRAQPVDVCVVDMVMPGLSGPDLIDKILAIDPSIACIAISGHDVPALFRRVAANAFSILRKPIAPEELLRVIARARGRAAVDA